MTWTQKLKILLTIFTATGVLATSNFVFKRTLTGDEARVRNFYLEEKDSLDMVFIGASTAYTDYSAPLAWHEFGITSYSLATNSAPMGIAKSMVKEVLKYQKPKLILIDINGILYNDDEEVKEASLRRWIDNMRDSENKEETIKELVPEGERDNYRNPLVKYHNNWEKADEYIEATKREIYMRMNKENLAILGDEGSTKIAPQNNLVDIKNYQNCSPMYKKSGQHLIDLLEYLKKEDINNVVFTNMPRFYKQKMIPERERYNEAKRNIKAYGYTCLDLDDHVEEIGLNPKTDFYNYNHLNMYGREKSTKYLISYLLGHYKLASDHNENIVKKWNQEYESYKKLYQWADEKMKSGEDVRYTTKEIMEILNLS